MEENENKRNIWIPPSYTLPRFHKNTQTYMHTHTHSLHAWSHNWHEGQHAYRQKQPDGLPTNQQCVRTHIRKWFLIISFYILHLVFSDFFFLFILYKHKKTHFITIWANESSLFVWLHEQLFILCQPNKNLQTLSHLPLDSILLYMFCLILLEEGLELQPSPALTGSLEMTAPPCLYSLYYPTVRLVSHCTISLLFLMSNCAQNLQLIQAEKAAVCTVT